MNIIYIGNKLQNKNRTATTIDTLGSRLEALGFNMKYASSKSNKILRLLDMINTVITYSRWADKVLIDTYSTQNFWYAISLARICRLLGIPYIPILHGGNLPARLQSQPKIFKRFLNAAQHIVCPSAYLEQAFAKANFSNINVIPNSIQGEHYTFNKRESITPKLLWVRSLAAIYNPQMAIHALKSIAETYPNASLTMVGPDKENMLPELRRLANEHHLDITFTGLLSIAEWIALSDEHDIFINTSHFDNLPVSLLEAMALGLPVISTEVGGIPNLIDHGKNGILIADDDAQQMADQIKLLIQDPAKAAALSMNGRLKAESYFWEQVKQQWFTILT
ncbi:glycosyltransferase family 4 protein [Nonlabens ponticola]|uniref:Glycosyltransferase family 1 protein n=1 Tax=Nonlabens ponticola TaxID=2496866 RepID=A0A3S9MXW2_9FLAO|nr:glycosyltransferase family 4 protein [Nonlabens ponticola]AZQ43883.1 glycosyltransferase family 1 protein [Nonlabens ponticola]